MKSTVSVRGQTVIIKEIRDELGIEPSTKLSWSVSDGQIVVRVLPADPIQAMWGIPKGRGPTSADLLEGRKRDREREELEMEAFLKRWRRSS